MITKYDINRIENAIWVLLQYENEIIDTIKDNAVDDIGGAVDEVMKMFETLRTINWCMIRFNC